jgi:nitroreductase
MNTHPSAAEIARGLSLASHAPSVHNTQPWQWRATSSALELFADRTRRLQQTDPHGRLLLLSCGASLHHLVVAMGAAGWEGHIRRFPDPGHPSHLASITFEAREPSEEVNEWAEAIAARRSDRRPMSSWDVPEGHLRGLIDLAAGHGVVARPLSDKQVSTWMGLAATAEHRKTMPAYREELYEWTHRSAASRDGIPAASRVSLAVHDVAKANRFPPGDIAPPRAREDSRAVPLLLTASSDDPIARLRSGEALSAVLLEATRLGLATSIDSQVLEVAATRRAVEDDLLRGTRSPQVLVTVGWPSSADPLPQTPRRPTSDIFHSTVDENEMLSEDHPPTRLRA